MLECHTKSKKKKVKDKEILSKPIKSNEKIYEYYSG